MILNSATADKTYDEVVDLVGSWVTTSTDVTPDQYKEGMSRLGHPKLTYTILYELFTMCNQSYFIFAVILKFYPSIWGF
jgi:hypothetical protein